MEELSAELFINNKRMCSALWGANRRSLACMRAGRREGRAADGTQMDGRGRIQAVYRVEQKRGC